MDALNVLVGHVVRIATGILIWSAICVAVGFIIKLALGFSIMAYRSIFPAPASTVALEENEPEPAKREIVD